MGYVGPVVNPEGNAPLVQAHVQVQRGYALALLTKALVFYLTRFDGRVFPSEILLVHCMSLSLYTDHSLHAQI